MRYIIHPENIVNLCFEPIFCTCPVPQLVFQHPTPMDLTFRSSNNQLRHKREQKTSETEAPLPSNEET